MATQQDVGAKQTGGLSVGAVQANNGAQTITPASPAIGTHAGWFTPVLSLKIYPSAIATHRAWFTPNVIRLLTPAAPIGPLRAVPNPTLTTSYTITPSLVGPLRSIPSPGLAGPLSPATIASRQSWPTPLLIYDSILAVTRIGPARFFANPTVAGPISNATIASQQNWPTPFLNVLQTITLAAPIAGPRAMGTATVAFITVITVPTAFSHGRTIYGPVVASGPQFVNVLGGIPARRSWPTPAIDGGLLECRWYLGGVEITEYISWDQPATIESQTIGRWRAQFSLVFETGIPSWRPQVGQTVLVIDHGHRIFAGCLSEVVTDRVMMTSRVVFFHCTAADKSGICDHRVVPGKTYLAGADVYQTIADINTNFLNGEGITLGGVPSDGSLGTLASDLILNFDNVTRAFDAIASDAGLMWWVDAFCVLFFTPLTDLPAAPFTLTETSLNWRKAEGAYGLTVRETLTDYYNKIYAVSNLNILPGSGSGGGTGAGAGNTETFTFTVGQPGIITTINGLGVEIASGIQVSVPIGSVTSLTVNGVGQTVVDYGAYTGQVPNPPDLLWFFAGPATGSPSLFLSPSVLPAAGAVIAVTYIPAVSTSSSVAQYGTALNPLDPHGDPLGTCGSGVFEGVVQVQNIADQANLDAIALAALARIGGVPKVIEFQTDHPGLAPGQKLLVDVPLSGADALETLITDVHGTFIPPELANGGSFRWNVSSRSNLDPGNWLKWYERFVARTMNPLPVLQYEDASFVIPAGSLLSGGVNIANPYIVKRTGKVIELLVTASTPPTGQDLRLIVEANGATLIGQIDLPGTAAANQLFTVTIPDTVNLYVFARQVLNVTATYSVTGTGTPTRASGVTLAVRWAM